MPQDATTFLDLDYWLEVNILRAAKLGLHRRSGIAVLDLGSGTGLLLYICEVLGHRAIGLDLPKQMLQTPEREIYIELSRASEVKVIRRAIQAFEPLPVKGQFDLITSFLVCFNRHNKPDEWGRPEWNFFVSDLLQRLRPGGQVALKLNQNVKQFGEGGYIDQETHDFF